ncbi:hypothetical protein DFS34DRAFT_398456 [Phlyctochytrium arcticum]|nr:hypothetical protein DFS34DRAFT_398456 [Phlyctochytrium arcticum]
MARKLGQSAMRTTVIKKQLGWAGILCLFITCISLLPSSTAIPQSAGQVSRRHGTDSTSGVLSSRAVAAPEVAHTTLDASVLNLLYFRKSSVVLLYTTDGQVHRSEDEGKTWKRIMEKDGVVTGLGLHETDDSIAFAFTTDKVFISHDRMGTYQEFQTPSDKNNRPVGYNGIGLPVIDFHPNPANKDWYTFLGGARGCPKVEECFTTAYYTKDSGKTWTPIDTWANKCVWARDVKFDSPEIKEDAVYCVSYKNKNDRTGQEELNQRGGRDNTLQLVEISEAGKKKRVVQDQGVAGFYVVNGVMVVAYQSGEEVKLRVSLNGNQVVDAKFPPDLQLRPNSYKLLQSTTTGLFVEAEAFSWDSADVGTLFKSNENGTYFSRILDNVNRQENGLVDYERMQGMDGIILTNIVANAGSVHGDFGKEIQTRISVDDGSTWSKLKGVTVDGKACEGDKCALHLFSQYPARTTPNAPGFMLAVGNVGDHLVRDYNDADVYMTRDAGQTWVQVSKDAHLSAIGDHGGLLVLVNNEGPTQTLKYSTDFGKTWAEYKFAESLVSVRSISTEPMSTSVKMVIVGKDTSTRKTVLSYLDFSSLLTKKCGNGDFETWSMGNGQEGCVLGQKLTFKRRKDSAACWVGEQFKEFQPTSEPCDCSKLDFECDYNFFRDPDTRKCVGTDPKRPAVCKPGETYQGSSGYRKIAASKCKGGEDLAKDETRTCGSGVVPVTITRFESPVDDYFYFPTEGDGKEIVMIKLANGAMWWSEQGGAELKRVLPNLVVVNIMLDPVRPSRAFFTGTDAGATKLYVTEDAGQTYKELKVPPKGADGTVKPHGLKDQDKHLLWEAREPECTSNTHCFNTVWYSTDGGHNWGDLVTKVDSCNWVATEAFNVQPPTTVFCTQYVDKTTSGPRAGAVKQLVKSTDLKTFSPVLDNVIGFAVYAGFMIVPVKHVAANQLIAHISTDGSEWAQAKLPNEFTIPDVGYTVVSSTTGRLFLAVLATLKAGQERGSLIVSNWNGTEYSLSVPNLNHNRLGFADFERVQGFSEIAIINEISNPEQVQRDQTKKLRSKITYNNGAEWSLISPPREDSRKNKYSCSGGLDKCSLNIHSYTSREDVRDQFSAEAAVGMMMAVGSIGDHLDRYIESDTFLTRDAGQSWTEVVKDAHRWEFGNNGGILILVNDEEPTSKFLYSVDMGATFQSHDFGAELGGPVKVSYMFSEPRGTGKSFLVAGTVMKGVAKGEDVLVRIGFDAYWDRTCKLEMGADPLQNDFEAWSPTEGKCFFGAEMEYYRRRPTASCLIQSVPTPKTLKTCQCTRADFECAYNHARDASGNCVLLPNLQPASPACIDGKLRKATAYHKMPETKCVGGEELHIGEVVGNCEQPRKLGALSWILILMASFGTAGVVTWGFIRHKGRLFGRIR